MELDYQKKVTRTYRVKLYPTPNQEQKLLRYWDTTRFVYNLCVEQRARAAKQGIAVDLLTLAKYADERIQALQEGHEWVHPLGEIPKYPPRDENGKAIILADLKDGKRPAVSVQVAQMKILRKERGWHKEGLAYKPFQAAIRGLDAAWKSFYGKNNGKKAPPSFKRKNSEVSLKFIGGSAPKVFDKWHLQFGSAQEATDKHRMKVRMRYDGIPDGLDQYRVTEFVEVVRARDGQWWAHFVFKNVPIYMTHPKEDTGRRVGIDLGITHLVTTSNGQHFANVRAYRDAQEKLAKTDKAISRLVKTWLRHRGYKPAKANMKRYRREALSSNRGRALSKQRNRQHLKVKRKRKDAIAKAVHSLVMNYDFIAMEELNIKDMAKGRLSKHINDAGWGMFKVALQARCKELGVELVTVNPAYTSQTCNECGYKDKANRNGSAFVCQKCGHTEDADVNGAKNILARATASIQASKPRQKPIKRKKAVQDAFVFESAASD